MIFPIKSYRNVWVLCQNSCLLWALAACSNLNNLIHRHLSGKDYNIEFSHRKVKTYWWRKLKRAGKTTADGEKTQRDVSLYWWIFLSELLLCFYFIFKAIILLKIIHFWLYIQSKKLSLLVIHGLLHILIPHYDFYLKHLY